MRDASVSSAPMTAGMTLQVYVPAGETGKARSFYRSYSVASQSSSRMMTFSSGPRSPDKNAGFRCQVKSMRSLC